MSLFINKKEEVLQIELTPYGKSLFSLGKFMPAYYSFYDEDILYDGAYGIGEEKQNNIVTRIKETPRLGVQSFFTSSIGNTNSTTNISAIEMEQISEASTTFLKPLGSSSPWSDYAPAWHITTMSDSVLFSGSSFQSNMALPTLSSSLNLEYLETLEAGLDENSEEDDYIVYDLIRNDRILIDILELNTIFKSHGNYDIEVFRAPLVTEQRNGQNSLIEGDIERLSFLNEKDNGTEFLFDELDPISANQGIGDDDVTIEDQFPSLGSKFVEFFLSIRTDTEIEEVRTPTGENLYKAGRISSPEDICRPISPAGEV